MPSLTAQVYAETLFLLSFSLLVMTTDTGNCNRGDLLLVSPLILHTSLGQSMLMARMALLESASCPVILMSWAIPSLPTLERWVLSSFCSLFLPFLFLFHSLTLLSSNCSALSKSMRNWYGWLGTLSWRWPTTRGICMVLEERPTSSSGDDDGGGEEEDLEATPSYQPRKRRHRWLHAVTAYTHSFFFFSFAFNIFLYSL